MKTRLHLVWGCVLLYCQIGSLESTAATTTKESICDQVISWSQSHVANPPNWNGEQREAIWFLLALYERGTTETISTANSRLDAMLRSPVVNTYIDKEQTLKFSMFTASTYTILMDRFRNLMPKDLQTRAMERMQMMVETIDETWEPEHASDENFGHTNYALMWMHAYLRGSELIKDTRIHAKAIEAFHQWCDYTLHNGITEFNATTYYKIDLITLSELADRSEDLGIRRRAAGFVNFIWLDVAMHYWPSSERTIGANARTYSLSGVGGTLNYLKYKVLKEPITVDLGDEILYTLSDLIPPEWFAEIAREKSRLDYTGTWLAPTIEEWRKPWAGKGGGNGAYGNRFGCERVTHVTPNYTLGTGGDGYAWQDRMLVADFSTADASLPLIGIQINNKAPLSDTVPLMNFTGRDMRHWPLRTASVQKNGAAMILCTIDVPEKFKTPAVAPLLLFPADAQMMTLNGVKLDASPGLHSIEAGDILFIKEGNAYASLRFVATGEGFANFQPTYAYRVDGERGKQRFGALMALLYSGANTVPPGKNIRVGFVVEMADVSDFPDLKTFQNHILKDTQITQSYKAGIWDATYSTGASTLGIRRDVDKSLTLNRTIDGVRAPSTVHRSTISDLDQGLFSVHWKSFAYTVDLTRQTTISPTSDTVSSNEAPLLQ